jgi:hypothetical protein
MFKAPNNIFSNWNKKCYIRPILEPTEDEFGNELPQYGDYKEYLFNYQPVKDEAELKAYGITSQGTIKAVIDYNKFNNAFKQFDLAYLYGKSPEDEEINGENANYRVITFIPQNTKILVYFERLTKEE